ncbi:hypothetical protein Poly51_52410 [Rubripirellula tenax]|uniref:Uncharacterized protein n=1 Tax=Rubripirellula tenax TaxID=2528015 RepID=A0A5C6EIG5_9BACT|nr:hypothetical protein Poly51_52410 [Rubripirellula tenax]
MLNRLGGFEEHPRKQQRRRFRSPLTGTLLTGGKGPRLFPVPLFFVCPISICSGQICFVLGEIVRG